MTTNILRRYTSIPCLLELLQNKKITFLDPETWDDENDRYYLKKYKDYRKLASVLVLCFTIKEGTYHHWKIYSAGSSGVCIRFDKKLLLSYFQKEPGIHIRKNVVKYPKQNTIKYFKKNELPFRKRFAFTDELEYRIICECETAKIKQKSFNINISCIKKIVLNPWMSKNVAISIKNTILNIKGCKSLKNKITFSNIINSTTWKKYADNAI
ncbi:MAG: DUF2971 domain-containing protein [Chitinispirillaceae bacterium]|jgi:hypothetical protein